MLKPLLIAALTLVPLATVRIESVPRSSGAPMFEVTALGQQALVIVGTHGKAED